MLDEYQHLVTLMIDEIFVSPTIIYKGGNITGFATDSDSVPATTVQASKLLLLCL